MQQTKHIESARMICKVKPLAIALWCAVHEKCFCCQNACQQQQQLVVPVFMTLNQKSDQQLLRTVTSDYSLILGNNLRNFLRIRGGKIIQNE